MKTETIVLKGRASAATAEDPQITCELPENFQEASDLWGPEVAENLFSAGLHDAVTRFAKSRFAGGMAPADLQEGMVGWKPGTRASRGRKPAKVSNTLRALSKLSDEEVAVLREKLKEDPRFAVALAG